MTCVVVRVDANALINIPLFEDMEHDQISAILKVGTQREVTVDDKLYVYVNGRLRIVSASGVTLSEVTESRVIGEMGVFTGQIRTSSVVAEEPSMVLEQTRSSLEELVEANPELDQHIHEEESRWNASTNSAVKSAEIS